MKCTTCNSELADGAYYCPVCGALVSDRPEYVLCPHCACKVEKGAAFCPFCGGDMNGELYELCPFCRSKVPHGAPRCPSCGKVLKKEKNTPLMVAIITLSIVVAVVIGVLIYIFWDDLSGAADDDISLAETIAPELGEMDIPTEMPDMPTLGPAPTVAVRSRISEPTERVIQVPPTPAPTTAPTPIPTPTPVPEHIYEVVVSHVSWDEARRAAERNGGHLVTFSDQVEFEKVISMMSSYPDLKNVWIGAVAPEGLNSYSEASAYWSSGNAEWITGEPFTYAPWRQGEPSGYDAQLGVAERYVQIFRPQADGGEWSYNDAGNDLSEYKEGSLGYVIEYE